MTLPSAFEDEQQLQDSSSGGAGDDYLRSSLAAVMRSVLDLAHRHLQQVGSGNAQQSRGRFILMTLYLCMLALCFVTPIFYYFRLRCEDNQSQRLRRMEAASMAVALEESQQQNRQESRAVWRKYVEERRARMIQLFAPVRMILKEEHFVTAIAPPLNSKLTDETGATGCSLDEAEEELHKKNETEEEHDIETGTKTKKKEEEEEEEKPAKRTTAVGDENIDDTENPYGDDETTVIRIPLAGLHLTPSEKTRNETMRTVPGMCTICLCAYKVGSDIVWSSNDKCDHVFHESCIERWLMKQREGPLCPCCRRDFVVDPYDLEDGKRHRGHHSPIPEEPWTDWTETMDFDEFGG